VAHASDPWTMEQAYKLFASGKAKTMASKEPALLFLIPFLALMVAGAGALSIDGITRSRRRGA
jgi:uncharacterized membrane protein YphA (DoxX/SURF4 family)